MPRVRVASKADRTDPATGIVFDSKGELTRWHELQLLQRSGAISELRRQVKFELYACNLGKDCVPVMIRSDRYYKNGKHAVATIDFAWRENGQDVYEDYHPRDLGNGDRLRHALVEACYNIRIQISGINVRQKRSKAA